ncbi:MAG: 5-nitroimidazole antibiotic resistance protein [Clostridiales bacterium]|nr:5-nitroimidazole antibiotic resistance protein [Clostridiales bacterium]
MRRKDREREAAFAWDTLQKAPYATLAMTDEAGRAYCIPISPVADPAYGVIYFHCAGAGMKLDALRANPHVCLSAVGSAAVVPNEFEMDYTAAVFRGMAEVVTEEEERVRAMLLLCTFYDPKGMGRFDEVMGKYFAATTVVKIVPDEITGKECRVAQADPFAHHHA